MSSSTSNSERRRRARWPVAATLAVAIALGIEGTAALATRAAPPRDLLNDRYYPAATVPAFTESIIQWQVYDLMQLHEAHDVLLLGDSSCLMGLVPKVVEEGTGLTVWNAGTVSWLYGDGFADLLELYVRRVGPPRLLVYHISEGPLTDSLAETREIGALERVRRWLDPNLPTFPPSRGWRMALVRAARSAYEARFLGGPAPILAAARGPLASDDEVRRLLAQNQGFLPNVTTTDWKPPLDIQESFQPDCLPGMRRIFECARQHGFPVLLMIAPLPVAADTPATRASFSALEAAVREELAHWPEVSIFPDFLQFLPDELCGTLHHPTEAGARVMSEKLAAWIAAHPPPPRASLR